MPRFYFDTSDNGRRTRDDDGSVFPNRKVARRQAVSLLPDIVRDVLPDDGEGRHVGVDVRDGTGRVVFTATLSLVARWID